MTAGAAGPVRTALFSPGWNANKEAIEGILREEDKKPDAASGKDPFFNRGTQVVVTTYFEPGDYKEFLKGAWPEFPFGQMDVYIVT